MILPIKKKYLISYQMFKRSTGITFNAIILYKALTINPKTNANASTLILYKLLIKMKNIWGFIL